MLRCTDWFAGWPSCISQSRCKRVTQLPILATSWWRPYCSDSRIVLFWLPRCQSYDGSDGHLAVVDITTWQDNWPSPGGGSCWEWIIPNSETRGATCNKSWARCHYAKSLAGDRLRFAMLKNLRCTNWPCIEFNDLSRHRAACNQTWVSSTAACNQIRDTLARKFILFCASYKRYEVLHEARRKPDVLVLSP